MTNDERNATINQSNDDDDESNDDRTTMTTKATTIVTGRDNRRTRERNAMANDQGYGVCPCFDMVTSTPLGADATMSKHGQRRWKRVFCCC
jgi:hypothetical protein